ncbi:hypothetical protein DICVIV_10018 [Dictyocaulus viviparus]|uniref:Uncharacterized protein n=1 Tax=Dictyocaulus viviparus TaxID=29172 RepID=A0A0D8XJP0_DICVI|nr:hypothetical protein DICVIV_10018 [Dictyocaulus viviparus]
MKRSSAIFMVSILSVMLSFTYEDKGVTMDPAAGNGSMHGTTDKMAANGTNSTGTMDLAKNHTMDTADNNTMHSPGNDTMDLAGSTMTMSPTGNGAMGNEADSSTNAGADSSADTGADPSPAGDDAGSSEEASGDMTTADAGGTNDYDEASSSNYRNDYSCSIILAISFLTYSTIFQLVY